ncbi:MAG: uroporphyrinogen decarboxylase [Neisseriaceae bacterium]
MLKNDLLLRVLKQEIVERPPVWLMRQAGRYLPEYRKIRERYDFFTRCRTPELVAELTVQPIDRLGVDAAILFSDILVVPQAMGIPFKLLEDKGPYLDQPIRTRGDVDRVIEPEVNKSLEYVLKGIQATKERLAARVPLIGFAGAPWTIFCYSIEGKSSKDFSIAKAFAFEFPELAHRLLKKITKTTTAYLEAQVQSGVEVIQIFDSWGGILSPKDYLDYSWRYISPIVERLANLTQVIVFAKGTWFALNEMAQSSAAALGIDWSCPANVAKQLTQGKVALQGNLDPSYLLAPIPTIQSEVKKMLKDFSGTPYIAGLGHGILAQTPVENVQAFVNAVKDT